MSSANKDSFIYSFPTYMFFTSLSCLTAVAGISGGMLNRSGENKILALFPVFWESVLSLAIKNDSYRIF